MVSIRTRLRKCGLCCEWSITPENEFVTVIDACVLTVRTRQFNPTVWEFRLFVDPKRIQDSPLRHPAVEKGLFAIWAVKHP